MAGKRKVSFSDILEVCGFVEVSYFLLQHLCQFYHCYFLNSGAFSAGGPH